MYCLGCDLGSTTGKAVLLDVRDGRADVVAWAVEPSGFVPSQTARLAVGRACERAGVAFGDVAASCCTGYGRENVDFVPRNVSEISCHARGAHFFLPRARTVVDVGGQDVKVVALSKAGKVLDFAMNDKCAAGTGRFFEMMARTLRVEIAELGAMALLSSEPAQISSTCSVFAESEVISCINKGVDRNDIAGGIHVSIARRLTAMVNRMGLVEDVVLTGGCAKNPGLKKALEGMLGVGVATLPCDPQINGAVGAALYAYEDGRPEGAAGSPELGAIADPSSWEGTDRV